MVRLGIWLVVAVVLALLVRRRPDRAALLGLTVWVMIPGVAKNEVVGALPDRFAFHPASLFIVIALLITVLERPKQCGVILARHFVFLFVAFLVGVVAFLVTAFGGDLVATTVVVDQMLAPMMMFFLLLVGLDGDRSRIVQAQQWVVALAGLQAALACLQFLTGSALLHTEAFASNYFFNPETWTRWMGTTDHPLTLAFLLGAAVPLASTLRPVPRTLLVLLLAVGMLITQSRTGLGVFAFGLFVLVLRSRASVGGKIGLLLLSAGGAVGLLLSPLASGVQGRIADDTGSTLARSDAWSYFLDHLSDYFAIGDGISSSFRISREAGLQTSFESSIVMYAIGLGIIPTLIYFGLQLKIVLGGIRRVPLEAITWSAVIVLVVPHTYSALAVTNLAGSLSWVVLGICAASCDAHRVPALPDRRSAPTALTAG